MITIVAWIVVLGVLVAVHELGHFLVAKGFSMRVDEYSLGFGRSLWKRRWGETLYAVRMIPLGGYVRLGGMDGERRDDPRDFPNRPLGQRFLVILAGPVMNVLLAVILYAVAFGPVGQPVPTTTVAHTLAGYPAARAGIRPGDRIVSVDGHPIRDWTNLQKTLQHHARQRIAVGVERGHHLHHLSLTTRYDRQVKAWLIGIQPAMRAVHLGLLRAVGRGAMDTARLAGAWFGAMVHLLEGHGPSVEGPVGIAVQVRIAANLGFYYLVLLSAALSLNLGLFNILPFPVLDGSRLVLIGLEGVRKKALNPNHEGLIHLAGMVILLLMVVLVTFHDVASLVRARGSS